MTVAIIGSGFAGLAAAHGLARAGVDAVVYEARDSWGGHTASEVVDGFVFDEGPHVSFTRDERVRRVFEEGARQVVEFTASISNIYQGTWLRHPAQCHLHGLDPALITRCISDFVKAQADPPAITTYADWLEAMYGRAFATTFPGLYTRKYWTVEASAMDTDWVSGRMYPPKLEEIVRGALAPENEGDFHYLSTFRYPASGGYQSFMSALRLPADVRTGKRVVWVDVSERALGFADGTTAGYDALISTMPLPELVGVIKGVPIPAEVQQAAGRLLCSSMALVDIAVDRPDLSSHHWFYAYDEDISFSRAHFPHMMSPTNAPRGGGSIQAEVYFSTHRPLPCASDLLPTRVVEEMVKIGILRGSNEVRFARHREVRYANVVFDLERSAALSVVRPWVDELGVVLAGRYGEWGYHWTDDATNAGWRAAAQVTRQPVDALLT